MPRPHVARRAITLSVGFLCLLGCGISLADETIIDSFGKSDGDTYTSPGNNQRSWTHFTGGEGTVGEYRDGSIGGNSGLKSACIANDRLFVMANPGGEPRINLSYDNSPGWGNDRQTEPFNGSLHPARDLTDSGANSRFEFQFTFADKGKKPQNTYSSFFKDFRIRVKEANGGDSHTYSFNAGLEARGGDNSANQWMADNGPDLEEGTARAFTIPFTRLKAKGASLDDVEAFQFSISSNQKGTAYSIDRVVATPEPATTVLALLAAGAGAFAVWRKRKKE